MINICKVYFAFFILVSCNISSTTETCTWESYNLKGKVKTFINENGKVIEFDTNGKGKDGSQCNRRGDKKNPFSDVFHRWGVTYDKYGRPIAGDNRDWFRKTGTWTATYDTIKRIKRRNDFDLDGKLDRQYVYKYDSLWRISEINEYERANDKLSISGKNYNNSHTQSFAYDLIGNCNMEAGNGDTIWYKYDYDEEGNWIHYTAIHKIIGNSETPTWEATRKITYY